jgi:hypothetical protein
MRISGFTMVKNAGKLYYPIRESIESILPIVDEFIIALGDCDIDDTTLQQIQSIQSNKIRIIHTVWDIKKYPNGTENAHQTDIAKNECTGDWLFYLQADELIHEKYHSTIVKACNDLLNDQEVEGILFKYIHFWGDYNHYQHSHGWYPKEIRIIRNDKDIHSWESAQSFRRIPGFDGLHYRQKDGTFKLKVAEIDAYVYHYGWVRPPYLMQNKNKSLHTIHKGEQRVSEVYKDRSNEYDYGPLGKAPVFTGTHPAVMEPMINKFNWKDQLNYSKKHPHQKAEKHKQDRFKNKILTFIEQNLLGGKQLFGFKNYVLVRRIK